jgi:hypothetical protein
VKPAAPGGDIGDLCNLFNLKRKATFIFIRQRNSSGGGKTHRQRYINTTNLFNGKNLKIGTMLEHIHHIIPAMKLTKQ